MRHSPGFYPRLTVILMQNLLVRMAIGIAALGILVISNVPIWMVITIPILLYVGLTLAISTERRDAPRPHSTRGVRAEYAACEEMRDRLHALVGRVPDEGAVSRLNEILGQLEDILEAIAEDEKYDAAPALHSLLDLNIDLIEKYVKVVRVRRDDPRTHDGVRDNLSTLSAAYAEFWDRLTSDAVVDFEALSETIRVLLDRMNVPRDEAPSVPSSPAPTVPLAAPERQTGNVIDVPVAATNGHSTLARLTPRETEVICLLAEAKTDQQIADALFISRRTVTTHVTSICSKLGCESRTAAALHAVRHGLCPLPDSAAQFAHRT